MKTYRRYKKILTVAATSLLISCSGGSEKGSEPLPIPKPKPVWNKENTANICLFSTLGDDEITNTEATYNAIASHVKNKKQQLLLIDKTKTGIASGFNGSVKVANALKGYFFLGINRLSDSEVEGTGIITKQRRGAIYHKDGSLVPNVDTVTIEKDEQFTYKITEDCSISGTQTFVKEKVAFPFAAVRFENSTQINKAEKIITQLMKSNFLLIGTVSKDSQGQLKSTVKKHEATMNYKIDFVDSPDAERVVFVAHPHFWVLRECEAKKAIDNIYACELKIEANVF